MRCAIECIQFLLVYYKYSSEYRCVIKTKAERYLHEQGMSIYDLIELLNGCKFTCLAIKTLFVPKQLPCIIYFKNWHRTGHFIVLIARNRLCFTIYDGTHGVKSINKLWFYIFWSHICILCYNDTKRGT